MDSRYRYLTEKQIADHWNQIWIAALGLEFGDEHTRFRMIDAVEGYVTANLAAALARAGLQGDGGGGGGGSDEV